MIYQDNSHPGPKRLREYSIKFRMNETEKEELLYVCKCKDIPYNKLIRELIHEQYIICKDMEN